jgi:hypothetical protein
VLTDFAGALRGSRRRRLGLAGSLAAGGGGPARCLSVGDARRGPPPQRRSPAPAARRSPPSRTLVIAPARGAGPSSRAGRSCRRARSGTCREKGEQGVVQSLWVSGDPLGRRLGRPSHPVQPPRPPPGQGGYRDPDSGDDAQGHADLLSQRHRIPAGGVMISASATGPGDRCKVIRTGGRDSLTYRTGGCHHGWRNGTVMTEERHDPGAPSRQVRTVSGPLRWPRRRQQRPVGSR